MVWGVGIKNGSSKHPASITACPVPKAELPALDTLNSLLTSSSIEKGWTFTSTFPSMHSFHSGYLQFTPLSDGICI